MGMFRPAAGGTHQRISFQQSEGNEIPLPPVVLPSVLAGELCEAYALGLMPANRVQSLAAAAVTDGCEHPELRALASLGAHGAQTQNCSRDLQTLYNVEHRNFPDAYVVDLPLYATKAKPPRVVTTRFTNRSDMFIASWSFGEGGRPL
mgnify:CR=1 FL=1